MQLSDELLIFDVIRVLIFAYEASDDFFDSFFSGAATRMYE